jgi:putative ABC transport system substrate-binding protein
MGQGQARERGTRERGHGRDSGAERPARSVDSKRPTLAARSRIAQFAIGEKLPSMFGWSEYVEAGGLSSYGASQRETHRRLATYADRLLHGARAADLPIEQPTQFEFFVNMRTAAALGIAPPEPSLVPADRRIE